MAKSLIIALAFASTLLTLMACQGRAQSGPPALVPSTTPAAITSATRQTRTAIPGRTLPAAPAQSLFKGTRAYQDVIAQMEFGDRPVGSTGLKKAGDYILSALQSSGWVTTQQQFEYRDYPIRNIFAEKGQGPLIILGAHYDARFRADKDQAHPNEVVPGANDGASGVAVLLELARVLNEESLSNRVMLAFFDAEDDGDLDMCRPVDTNCDHTPWPWSVGAEYVAVHLETKPEAVIVVDMIGDRDQNIYYEQSSNRQLQEQIWAIARSLGYNQQFIAEYKYAMEDDQTPFLKRGITAIDIIDFDYPFHHTLQDTADKVAPESLERVGRVLQTWLQEK